MFRKSRSLAVVQAAAKAHGWDTRPSPRPRAAAARGNVLTGRGIAYTYRSNTVAATIAEVEVNRETGRVWVKRLSAPTTAAWSSIPSASATPSSAACCTR